MDEDFGFDSGFDDVGSADLDIDSGFDDSSFDTDFSMDDIGSEDIISNDFSETDFSIDAAEDFDSFDDVESTELDIPSVEDDFLIETDAGLELPDDTFETDETTDIDVNDSSLGLDDFDPDIDMLETEDSSSLSELNTDDFDDTFETDNVTNDTVEDEELITEAEDDGYFEDIPNEIEPFVMEEAQGETGADDVGTMPEFEDESSEESESVLETDTFEETESPDDIVSNEPTPVETDTDTTGEEMVVEETDVPESDKSPYEAMRDYMYEHNYGQMDYPEYSQDPEWQELNEQYTDSLEETPSADEISAENSDQVLDTPDISESQDYNGGDVIDVQEGTSDNTSETPEAIEEPSETATIETSDTDVSEGDKTPYEAMRDYMYEHNYGQMDYPEYSQDPEWQALNEQYTNSLEETPSADEISVENSDQVLDTPDISEPQELNEGDVIDVQEGTSDNTSETPEVIEEPSETATIETSDTDVSEGDKTPYEAMRDYMYEHNYGQMDYPEYSQDPEWQALNEQYTNSLEETPSVDEISVENSDQVLDTPDISEPQELNEGDVIDVQEGTSDNTSETPEAIEEPSDAATLETADTDVSEGDKTPYEAMRDYMYEHNFGQTDYPEYSQDPEWQELNDQYTGLLEEAPAADEIASENLEQTEPGTTGEDITEGIDVDSDEIIQETSTHNASDMPEITESEEMSDDVSEDDIVEVAEAAETLEPEELHELTDAECEEIYEPWDGERLSESFEDINIAANPERLDSTLNDFVESNWENLSLDEQKQSMQSLADCVVDTIGFKNPPAIEFYNNPSEGDYGGYDSSTNTLSVNEYMLYDSNEAADTIAHELWHAHQHECALNPQSTRDLQYQFNFDNYIPPEYGMEDYQSQLIEAEARAFAEQFKDRLAQLRGRI